MSSELHSIGDMPAPTPYLLRARRGRGIEQTLDQGGTSMGGRTLAARRPTCHAGRRGDRCSSRSSCGVGDPADLIGRASERAAILAALDRIGRPTSRRAVDRRRGDRQNGDLGVGRRAATRGRRSRVGLAGDVGRGSAAVGRHDRPDAHDAVGDHRVTARCAKACSRGRVVASP